MMQEIENITAFLNFQVRFYNLEAHKTPQNCDVRIK